MPLNETLFPPNNVIAELTSDTSITLSWEDTNSGTTFYNIERSVNNFDFELLYEGIVQGTVNYIDTDIEYGSIYQYKIYPVDINSDFGHSRYSCCVATPDLPQGEDYIGTCLFTFTVNKYPDLNPHDSGFRSLIMTEDQYFCRGFPEKVSVYPFCK